MVEESFLPPNNKPPPDIEKHNPGGSIRGHTVDHIRSFNVYLTNLGLFQLNVHHHGVHGKAVPVFVQKFVFRFVARILFLRIEAYHSITTHVNHIYQVPPQFLFQANLIYEFCFRKNMQTMND